MVHTQPGNDNFGVMTKLQMVGGGKMGQALLGGMIAANWAKPEELVVVDLDPGQRKHLTNLFPGVQVLDVAQPGVDAVLATKPHHVLAAAKALPKPARVASVAAGITTSRMESVLPEGTPVVRIMPNTPALVGAGASALAAGSMATDDDLAWALSFLSAVGKAVVVTEAQLDAVTGLSGSGPAYFFLMVEALIDAGVTAGLPRPIAKTLAEQTMTGAAAMLAETGDEPGVLRAAVTTPAGTTAAGLRVLEQSGIRAALIDAVGAASQRSFELGTTIEDDGA